MMVAIPKQVIGAPKNISDADNKVSQVTPDDHAATEKQPSDLCASQSKNDSMMDKAFDYLNTKFCQPIIWVDNFFIDDDFDYANRAGSIVRWYNDFSYYEKQGFKYHTSLRAHIRLPGLNKRLKLIVDAPGKENPFTVIKGPDQNTNREIGLQYEWYKRGKLSFDVRASIRPKLKGELRYRYPLSATTITRFIQSLYQDRSITGETSKLTLEHSFNQKFFGRMGVLSNYELQENRWEYGSNANLYQLIDKKRALRYYISVYWANEPYVYMKNANVGISYRQNFIRKWLFFELTPGYNWGRELGEPRLDQAIMTFTFEIVFKNI